MTRELQEALVNLCAQFLVFLAVVGLLAEAARWWEERKCRTSSKNNETD